MVVMELIPPWSVLREAATSPGLLCVYAPYYIGTSRRKSRKNLQYSLDFEEIIP
jgi:hypothetical protein